MIVCIAEKPSVAKDIARIIGATTARDGYMEGNGYQVTWTFGCPLGFRLHRGILHIEPGSASDQELAGVRVIARGFI